MINKKIISFLVAGLFSCNLFANDIMPKFFDAKYKAYYKGDDVGFMDRSFYKENDLYTLDSHSKIKGAILFVPLEDERHEISNFFVDEKGKYHPVKYVMNRTGSFADFVMKADFDYYKKEVSMSYKDRASVKEINKNILDNVIYQLRIQHEMKNGNRGNVQYDITYKTGFRNFNFQYIGEENISIEGEKIKTLKLKQIRNNKKGEKKGAFIWVDPNRDFIVTKVIYFNKSGKEEAKFELIKYKRR